MDRHHEEEAEEETKAKEKPKQVMIKSKKIQENRLINQKFNAIIVKSSVIL